MERPHRFFTVLSNKCVGHFFDTREACESNCCFSRASVKAILAFPRARGWAAARTIWRRVSVWSWLLLWILCRQIREECFNIRPPPITHTTIPKGRPRLGLVVVRRPERPGHGTNHTHFLTKTFLYARDKKYLVRSTVQSPHNAKHLMQQALLSIVRHRLAPNAQSASERRLLLIREHLISSYR